MNNDLKEALETLHDFREFIMDNMTQSRIGSGHMNPMWERVATVLDKHGMNDRAMFGGLHTSRYFAWDQAYYCR